ncbi:hypothetical protein LSUE1_G005787 [Lachnellula suecica]|uniref:NAD dependent epimerase/dehydratase n=1 Tax=Lachnellula suecica TaxID=602035 RepID=A0A8T9C5P2_9HELO|nr:hypothetical protein LSUE1_G005787 [Lachnellula suecica]
MAENKTPATVHYANSTDLLQRTQSKAPTDLSKSLKVIGAGMSRTATVSFTLALSRLLDGPVCHSGSASLLREEGSVCFLIPRISPDFVKKWIKLLEPKNDEETKEKLLKELLAGYVGITDAPGYQFVGELVQAFPDAVVICTTRDEQKWWVSYSELMKTTTPWWIPYVFWSLPTMRWFGAWASAMRARFMGKMLILIRSSVNYSANSKDLGPKLLQVHHEYVRRVTPPEKVFFFDVKEGWGPLCKILNVPIPEEPFPHANDAKAVQESFVGMIKLAALRWLQWFAVVGVAITAGVYALK